MPRRERKMCSEGGSGATESSEAEASVGACADLEAAAAAAAAFDFSGILVNADLSVAAEQDPWTA